MVSGEFTNEGSASERSQLLTGIQRDEEHVETHQSLSKLTLILPVPLLVSIAVHMTAASTVSVYSLLFCTHPTQCEDEEKSQYAGSVAMATVLANITGLLSLGYFERIMRWDTRPGLAIWLSCRGMGVLGFIAGGVYAGCPEK